MKHKSKNHKLRRNPNVRMKINLLRRVVFTPCLCYQLQLGILDTGAAPPTTTAQSTVLDITVYKAELFPNVFNAKIFDLVT